MNLKNFLLTMITVTSISNISQASITEVNDLNTFNTEISKDMPVVVKFYASWCNPCKRMENIVKTVAQEYPNQVKFIAVNVDKGSDIANKYGIQSIPQLLFISKGSVKGKISGITTVQNIKNTIEKNLK